MSKKLKPCPFCDKKASMGSTKTLVSMGNTDGIRAATGYKMTFGGSCLDCKVEMYGYNTEAEAIKAWNRRAK